MVFIEFSRSSAHQLDIVGFNRLVFLHLQPLSFLIQLWHPLGCAPYLAFQNIIAFWWLIIFSQNSSGGLPGVIF